MGSRSGSIEELKRVRAERTPRRGHAPAGARKASSSASVLPASLEQGNTPTLNVEDQRAPETGAVQSGKQVECGQEETSLRRFASYLIDSQEQEREAVARELHDDIEQRLSLVQMLLSEVDPSQTDPVAVKRLQAIRSHIQNANETVRHISHRIYPAILKDLGLAAALNSLVLEFEQKQRMSIRLVCRNVPDTGSNRAGLAVYRIVQEALTNAASHAGDTLVDVALERQGRMLKVRVTDGGNGFDRLRKDDRACMGLRSMQERARGAGGDVVIHSSPGRGTAVVARIALE